MAKITELPTAGPLTGAEPVMVVQDGESRQSAIGPLVDVLAGPYAAIAEAAAVAAQAGVDRFRETIAQGIADFAVGEFFASAETGTTRIYQRTDTAPFYTDAGDGAAPLTLSGGDGRYAKVEDIASPTGGQITGVSGGATFASNLTSSERYL